jgi:thiol-disulfide isomerase/thioredoxin
MFKTTLTLVLAMLCLNFSSKVTAQTPENKAIDVTTKGLQIGQEVPDITINNLHNYKNAKDQPATTARLSDFKGKLLILDFWATWCSPCVAMIPKMDSLQQQFGDKIQFLSVTYQTEKEVMPFLNKLQKQKGKHYDLPIVTADRQLSAIFPHNILPHYVWIGGNGIVRAITGSNEINAANISGMVSSSDVPGLAQKTDNIADFDIHYPIFNQSDSSDKKYEGIFSAYQEKFKSKWYYGNLNPEVSNIRRITIANLSPLWMYRCIYGKFTVNYGNSRQVLEVKDSTKLKLGKMRGLAQQNWMKANTFCYELKFKRGEEAAAFAYAEKQLDTVFPQYVTSIEPRLKTCLVLIRSDSSKSIVTSGGKPVNEVSVVGAKLRNASFSAFFKQLDWVYIQSPSFPLLDNSGVTGNVDMDIDAPLNNIGKLNQVLDKYGLKFIKKECMINMLVIKDRNAK